MMVSKLWNSCFPEFTPEHVHRHNFYLCQWQRTTQVRIVYLLYRWITAITCLAALVCSLLDVGRTDAEHFDNHYAKWWIYLTHWGLLACTTQAWLSAWIVTQGMMVEREDFELMRQTKKSRLHHIYWVMYTCATVYSFIITMCYWVLVHNPEIHKIDTLNIMVHVFNSVIMLIDLAIVGHPIKLSHAYWTTGTGLVYAIFTAIYFLAGGTDRKNQTAIYPMLDWTKPGKAIIVTAVAILFVFVVHFGCFMLYRFRIWLFTKLCIREAHNRDGDMGEGLNDDTGSRVVHDYSHQQQYPFVHQEQPHSHQHLHQHQHQHHQHQHQHQHHKHHHHHEPLQQQQQQQQQQQHQQQQPQYQLPPASVVGLLPTMPPILHQSQQQQQQQQQYTQHYQFPAHQHQHPHSPPPGGVVMDVSAAAAVGVGVFHDNNKNHMSSLGGGRPVASQLETAGQQRPEQFLNPNQIVEYKM